MFRVYANRGRSFVGRVVHFNCSFCCCFILCMSELHASDLRRRGCLLVLFGLMHRKCGEDVFGRSKCVCSLGVA